MSDLNSKNGPIYEVQDNNFNMINKNMKKISDLTKDKNNKKYVFLNNYSDYFKPFHIERNLSKLTSSPLFLSIIKHKNSFEIIKNKLKRYISIENSFSKEFNLLNDNISSFSKDRFYILTLDEKHKKDSDYFINIPLDDPNINDKLIILNELLFKLREESKGFILFMNDKQFESLYKLSLRTYTDFIFIDDFYKSFFEQMIYIVPLSFEVDIDFNKHILVFDKTTNWVSMKLIKNEIIDL